MTYPDDSKLRSIPGFSQLKALRLNPLKGNAIWIIVDCTWNDVPPHQRGIGGNHGTYAAASFYAKQQYTGDYK